MIREKIDVKRYFMVVFVDQRVIEYKGLRVCGQETSGLWCNGSFYFGAF